MQKIINILKNRNTILVMSIVLGLTVGDIAHSIKQQVLLLQSSLPKKICLPTLSMAFC